ncbi:hypothetical protein LPJ64_000587 [Coemansia asiatica]|uniref:BHLH domain-containing protein n=1 Tax=Coemansia asiatica TaxID=1052880 RepID=A0A9W8CMS6_9FUNG|nr:hypothetical protein LPJ64_000587 [Coemansia asiatica]
MTDRRVSLPGFNEIARSLPKPQISQTHSGAAVPQPIPFADRPMYRSSGSPSPHNSYAASNASSNYMLNRHPSSASYPQQPYSSPPRHMAQGYALSPPLSTAVGAGSSSVMAMTAGKPMAMANSMQMVAQTADPARQMGNPASLPNNASFMHTPPPTAIPASSRYAPYYHMSKGTHPTSSPPMKMCRDSGESNLSRANAAAAAATPTLANHHRRSPIMTPQQQQMPGANVSSAAAQQQMQMQMAHAAHRSHYQQHHPAAISNNPMPLPQQPYMAFKHKQVKREPSVPELMVEEDEDDDVLDGYDEGRGQAADNGLSANGANGMMTTAKIRTIHKLAERRRRREMKNLFDTLRRCLPIDKTIRLSKWEVLKKAIDVINNQDAEIRMLHLHLDPAKAMPPTNMSQ